MADISKSFAQGFGTIGSDFSSYIKEIQNVILSKLSEDSNLAYSLGVSIGQNYLVIKDNQRSGFWEMIEKSTRAFPFGFGEGLGKTFTGLDNALKKQLLERGSKKEDAFAEGLGNGFGEAFSEAREIPDELLNNMNEDSGYAYTFGRSIGNKYRSCSKKTQKRVWKAAHKNKTFAWGLGNGIGKDFFDNEHNLDALNLLETYTEEHTDVANGGNFTTGFGFRLGLLSLEYNQEIQRKVWELAKRNAGVAFGLGRFFGYKFESSNPKWRKDIIKKFNEDSNFALGFVAAIKVQLPAIKDSLSKIISDKELKKSKFGIQMTTLMN